MTLKERWLQVKNWRAMLTRAVRLKVASWLVGPIGCITVAGDVLLMATQKVAELESYIEKSGEIRHQTHAYDKLTSRVRETAQLIEAAARAGDPGTNAETLVTMYKRARWASMSRNQQKKYQAVQAAQQMTRLPVRKALPRIVPPPKPKETVGAAEAQAA